MNAPLDPSAKRRFAYVSAASEAQRKLNKLCLFDDPEMQRIMDDFSYRIYELFNKEIQKGPDNINEGKKALQRNAAEILANLVSAEFTKDFMIDPEDPDSPELNDPGENMNRFNLLRKFALNTFFLFLEGYQDEEEANATL